MAQQTFEELVAAVKQAESRGKRYKDDGKTLTTSSKGALGEMQVMPKTILDPGFGVVPAKDKSPDEIARVGRDYLQAMKQKYGDTEKALIAYNWGPGSTDKWIAAGAKPEALPQETKTYVERVKGLLGGVSRETSTAKKDVTPAEEMMTKALPAGTTASVSRETMMKGMPDVKSMPASYQAAFALAALADAQDEEDDRVYNENKGTETEKFFAEHKPVNHLASLDLSVQPLTMADGGEVEEVQNTARKGEAYQELEKYLQARGEMPTVKIGGIMPDGTNGMFNSDNLNIGSGVIKISSDTPKKVLPSVLTHEMTHAADRQLKQQAIEQGMFGKSNQFTDAYAKLVGPEGVNRTKIARKINPEWASDNQYYRAEPKEVAAHGVGAFAGPNIQDRAPRHVDATAATEFQILMELAQRNVDKGPKGLEKIPAFFRKMGRYAEGGDVEGERLTPQQIERIAAQEAADRDAASTAAFIAQKSGIGRKEGNISKALKSGEGQVEMAKGMTMMPQNVLGAPVDLATMAMRPFGYDVEKPVMGSEWLKEKTRDAGLAFRPSEDPTLAGFFETGNIASGMVNPAGVTRSGVQAAEKTGEAAKMLARDFQQYNQQLAVPGATYVRRPAGGVFPTAKGPDEAPISALDVATQKTLEMLDYVQATPEAKDATRQFFNTKMHDYFKTKASSVSDPVREALINGRIKIPKDTPLEEQFPHALLNAARAGDVTAMRDIEQRFDNMMGVKSYRAKKADEGYDAATAANVAFNQTILQQMKANPQVIPDEFLLRLAKKDTSKLSKQEQAVEVANIRQKLADNPTLFTTIFEPKISRLLSERPVESVSPDMLARNADYYPALSNASSRQEGIMALNADVPITDLDSRHRLPDILGMDYSTMVEQAARMDPKELSRMSVPEFLAKAIPAVAKEKDFERKAEKVLSLVKSGKPVPKDMAQYGTKEFLPTDQNGMTWREIVDPQGTIIQSKFLDNSIAGYSKPGTYGSLSKGSTALKNGEVRLFGLYDKDGNVVTNVEFVTPKVASDPDHSRKANTITQMYGNGTRTGNVTPENYPAQMLDLVNALQPKNIPPSIKQLFSDNGLTVAPPPEPLNAARTIQMNLYQPPAQRAVGGMIERQPNDNRRYL